MWQGLLVGGGRVPALGCVRGGTCRLCRTGGWLRRSVRPRQASGRCGGRARCFGADRVALASDFLAEGKSGLAGAGRAGRLPKLSDEQLAQVEQALLKGPRANGFSTEMWTLARVADVIETVTGVRYGQTQTWTVLRERLGWSRQRPARRAVERDDEAIATWVKQDWPRIKKRAAPRRLDRLPRRERASLLPPVRGTWAPKGRTPVLRHRFSWTRLSMSGALAYRPDASEAVASQERCKSSDVDSAHLRL